MSTNNDTLDRAEARRDRVLQETNFESSAAVENASENFNAAADDARSSNGSASKPPCALGKHNSGARP
ncbi:hypothetical protein PG988_005279 [Apiospora saccharicola]